jgi:hypothetical protein
VAAVKHEQGENELRSVAEGDVEQPSDGASGTSGDVFRGSANPFRQRDDREDGDDEDEGARHGVDERQHERDGHEQEQGPPDHRQMF